MSKHMESLVDNGFIDLSYINNLAESVALESAGAAFLSGTHSTFSAVFDSAVTFFNGLKVGNFKPVTHDHASLIPHIEQAGGWAAVRLTPVSLPTGMKSKYVEFLTHTLQLLPQVESLEKRLSQVQAKLASLVNEPDRLKAQSGIQQALQDLSGLSPADLDRYKAHFTDNKRTTARLCDVYDRANDIPQAYKDVNQINQRLAKIDFAGIQKKVDRLVELAIDLKKVLDGEQDSLISGTVAKQMSGYVYAMASTVSLGSVMTHLIDEVNICMAKNIEEIKKK